MAAGFKDSSTSAQGGSFKPTKSFIGIENLGPKAQICKATALSPLLLSLRSSRAFRPGPPWPVVRRTRATVQTKAISKARPAGADPNKDQSYFLSLVPEDAFDKVFFYTTP
jgi:hypothetical protein